MPRTLPARPELSWSAWWSQDRLAAFARTVPPGYCFDRYFSGIHLSMPSLDRLRPGDWLYLVGTRNQSVQVYGRMQLAALLDVEAYRQAHPVEFAQRDPEYPQSDKLAWRRGQPGLAALWWSCCDGVALMQAGSRFTRQAKLAPEAARALRLVIGRREKALPIAADGSLRLASMMGVRQLTEDSAQLLEQALQAAGALDQVRPLGAR